MKIIHLLGIGAIAMSVAACTTNPITGRSSLQLANNSEIMTMSAQEYKSTLAKGKVITGTADAKRVVSVGNRIKSAAERYYQSIGRSADLASYKWEFNLLQSSELNAWCMPGGKVAVYTGILPVTKDDNGLAVVMGHEVSHALAGHGNERISQAMVAQYGGAILGSTISNAQWANIFQQVYPVGSQVALLKYGRNQESEADEMGLYLMSMAGYDPRAAIPFWNRMEAASQGSSRPPQFLSTHPNPETRISDIQKDLPKALEYYKAAGGKI
ncbi:M48 family metallopeptidase [Chryseobacterium daecheongense]|uniref:M48 family peptidase n=1 Tax=Chryseobacterium daecheongense TaxID=192389 RepID=A0A3N0VU21_9FLAO|nr:M48 family metallopeptidase [Chryseobacterium daecheongense]ROH96231.1 M48 family peptidase [Chryseobacterium daecheongense]TDX91347.1 peptidase M48-like protein [Chryseobacterium daecheongense]